MGDGMTEYLHSTAYSEEARLNALRNLPEGEIAVDRKSLERLWNDHIQLDRCIASLDEDGLIEILPNAAVRLPV